MEYRIEQHFEGRASVVRDICETILTAARKFGPVIEDPKKTSIHLNRKTAFAGIQTRRAFLILTVKASADIDSPRIAKREQASANRWHHEIKLHSPQDVDTELKGWLSAAYDLSE
jgi:hypothetical protein